MAYCARYGKEFSDTEPCSHCAWRKDMEFAGAYEFHWAPGSASIFEFRGKWYWTDETEDIGNYAPCNTQAEAEAQQKEYAAHL